MSFKVVEDIALEATQAYFSEDVTYKRGENTYDIRAVFEQQWVDIEGVSTIQLTAMITHSDLNSEPLKGDQIIYNSKTYRVLVSQPDGFGGYTLVLGE